MYHNDWFVEQAPLAMKKYAMGKGVSEDVAESAGEQFISQVIHLRGEDLYRDYVNKVSFILSSYQDHLDSKVEFPNMEANTWGRQRRAGSLRKLGVQGHYEEACH